MQTVTGLSVLELINILPLYGYLPNPEDYNRLTLANNWGTRVRYAGVASWESGSRITTQIVLSGLEAYPDSQVYTLYRFLDQVEASTPNLKRLMYYVTDSTFAYLGQCLET